MTASHTDGPAPVNVLCLKWGNAYGPEYVNVLYRMVRRHLSLPFRFVCFTENAKGLIEEVEVQALPEFEEPPWEYARYCSAWRKLALFREGFAGLEGDCLFLDLDVVILDNIDCFFHINSDSPGHCVAMIENWYQPGQRVGQASVMSFKAGVPSELIQQYEANPLEVLRRYPTEQAYISGALGERCRFYPDSWCASYKKHSMPQGLSKFFVKENKQPLGAKILVFHGRPNPPDAIAGKWGKPIAWYKRWLKPIHPSPWLSSHWSE